MVKSYTGITILIGTNNMSKQQKKQTEKKLSKKELLEELGTNEAEGLKETFDTSKPEQTLGPLAVGGSNSMLNKNIHVPDFKEGDEEKVEIHELSLEGGIALRGFVIIEEFNEQNIDHITEGGIIIPTLQYSKLDLKQDPNLRYEGGYKCKIVKVGKDVPKEYNVGDIAITFKPSPATAIRIEGKVYNFINWQDIALVFPASSLVKKSVSKKDAEAAGYFTDGTDIKEPNRTLDNEILDGESLSEKLLKQANEEKAVKNLKKAGVVGLDNVIPKIIKP